MAPFYRELYTHSVCVTFCFCTHKFGTSPLPVAYCDSALACWPASVDIADGEQEIIPVRVDQ